MHEYPVKKIKVRGDHLAALEELAVRMGGMVSIDYFVNEALASYLAPGEVRGATPEWAGTADADA